MRAAALRFTGGALIAFKKRNIPDKRNKRTLSKTQKAFLRKL